MKSVSQLCHACVHVIDIITTTYQPQVAALQQQQLIAAVQARPNVGRDGRQLGVLQPLVQAVVEIRLMDLEGHCHVCVCVRVRRPRAHGVRNGITAYESSPSPCSASTSRTEQCPDPRRVRARRQPQDGHHGRISTGPPPLPPHVVLLFTRWSGSGAQSSTCSTNSVRNVCGVYIMLSCLWGKGRWMDSAMSRSVRGAVGRGKEWYAGWSSQARLR